MNKLKYYDTFITICGSLDERIKKATGFSGKKELLERMKSKPKKKAIDIIIPNHCNQNCHDCYFREYHNGIDLKVDEQTLDEFEKIAKKVTANKENVLFFYPREITTDFPLLNLYNKFGIDRVITNGKLLHVPGMLEKLKEENIKKLSITFPGSIETYLEYTKEKPEAYNQLILNIQMAIKSGFEVNTIMPIYKKNVDEVVSTVLKASELGVKDIVFTRMKPLGKGKNLPNNIFANEEDLHCFLRNLNTARHLVKGKMKLSLYGGNFGVNFYNKTIFRYLAGKVDTWPQSMYLCPLIDQQYLGLMLGSHLIYGCFQGVSFEEFKIGTFSEKGLNITKKLVTSEWLHKNLRGMCSSKNCPEHDLCLGGCRTNAFSWAKQRGEDEPLVAGQNFCITQFLKELQKK
ncbi:MAG: hypothetical protein M1514_03740 [Patescibacteria group bacterium]|nr:hypothetical protein [Patescibacteria group bacterium]